MRMKKILSLLMLALVSIGTARAADEVVLYFAGTSANSINVNDFTLAITGNAEKKWSQGNGKISYSGKEYQTLKNSNGAQNTITCPEGRKATKVVFYVVTNADTAGKLSEFDGAECSDEVSSLKDYSKPTVIEKEVANKSSFTFTFSTKQVCFIAVVTLADSNEPQLAVSPKTLDLNLSPIVLTKSSTFTLTGANLTNGSYNLTLPNLAGLSVEPTSFTVADGAVNQEFTVTYSSNVDVTASTAMITAKVGDLSAGVTVNYSAKTVPTTLQSISEATSWDFDTDVTYSGKADYTMTDTEKEIVYADYDQLSYKATFNASALAFKGKYPFRNSNKRFAQEGTLKFNTTVPGTIVVKFSDTGSGASATAVKRYLIVNGEQTEYWSSRENNGDAPYAAQLDVTTGEIEVPAGDVTITGSSAIIVSKIVFTPKAEEPATVATITVPETITDGEFYYTTFSSDKALDFSGVKGIEAYTGVKTGNGAYLTLTQVEQIPANTGVVIKAAKAKDYTIPFAEGDVEAPEANDLIAAVETVSSSTVTNGYLINDYMDTWEGSALVFRSIGSAADIPAGTAYLSLTSAEEDEAYGFVYCKFPIAPGEVVTAANIGELKALTEAATVELTLTNAQVTFSKYDSESGVDAFVLNDAFGAIVIKGSEVTEYLTEGSVLNGKVTIDLQVADYSMLGGGIMKAYSLDMTSAMDLAYATMNMGTNVTVTEGTAEPIEVTEDNFTDYILSGYDWRFVKFANAVFNASKNTFSFLDGGLETQISDDFKSIVDESMFTDGAVFEVTGFINDNPFASDPVFTPVTVTPLASTLTVTVGADGYATFCSDQALDFTEATSIKAYTATLSGTDITFTRIYSVPANTGVLLWADGGASEEIPVVDGGGVTGIQNVLKGTMEAIPAGSLTGKYILAKNGENIGFYKAGATATLAAGKAYIEASAAARIILPGGETTGINGVEAAEADAAVYNLQGQRIQKAQKGLNIKNGRKYIVR